MVFDFSQHSLQFISHTVSYLSPLSEVPTSLQQLTFTSFPTHILNFFIKYLSPLSEVPTALQQLTFTRLPTHILNFFHQILLVASFRGADITSATYLYKFPNSYSQFSSSYLTSFPFLYTLFFLPLSSLLIVPVSSCSFLYNLLIILQFSSLLIKKKTTGRNESPPKSPRKLISL